MNPARQADAIFSTRGKSQRPVLVSPPSPLLTAATEGAAHSGAPRITRLHPPNAEQEGSQSCGMRVQRGARRILCPFDSFTSLLWITWRLLNINKRRLRGSNSQHATHTSAAPHMQHPHTVFYLPHSATCTHPHARSAHSSTDPIDYRVFCECVCVSILQQPAGPVILTSAAPKVSSEGKNRQVAEKGRQ